MKRKKRGVGLTIETDKLEDFRILSQRIMQLATQGLLRIDFLQEVLKILMEHAACDSVEMWIMERGKYFCSELIHPSQKPFHFSIMDTTKTRDGHIMPKPRKDSSLFSVYNDMVLGRYDASRSAFTKEGSYWISNTENSEEDFSTDGGYKSLMVIPILIEDTNSGLLHLKSRSPNFFTEKSVEFYEGIVQILGIAFTHRRAQVESRERVKELTCLYGIAKLAENPILTLEDILQGIVELLPPAWLYPETAAGRIILDGQQYSTPHFREGIHKQVADIIVDSEKRGVVEVVYSEKKPELDEGPFLKEERNLIDTVAKEVALIIERKQTEQDKEKLQVQLRHADRLATIGQLSAGVAHELNEPLGSILGFAQLVQKYPKLSEQVKKDIEKIMKASLHAREVVKKLMLFARQMPAQKTKVNLNQVVEEGLYFLESRCAKEGIEVVQRLSDDLPEVTADPSQLTQVLVNIVVNAIQAMPEGGQLTIKTDASNKSVMLIVEDTGIGMSEAVREKIFLPFYTTKDVKQGTGLGLAVVHGIVTSHGGTINVESRVDYGTKFEIHLPTAEPKHTNGGGQDDKH